MHARPQLRHSAPPGFRPGVPAPREFGPEHKSFKPHGSVHMGSVLRSTARMMLAGWIIDKLELKDPTHRTLAFAAAGIGMGYLEKYARELEKKCEPRNR
jgi:hypothetical protein